MSQTWAAVLSSRKQSDQTLVEAPISVGVKTVPKLHKLLLVLTILKFHIDDSNILWIEYYYQPCLNQKLATWGELCKKEIINIHLSVELLGARKWHKMPLDFTNLEFLGHAFSETLASILLSKSGSGAFFRGGQSCRKKCCDSFGGFLFVQDLLWMKTKPHI